MSDGGTPRRRRQMLGLWTSAAAVAVVAALAVVSPAGDDRVVASAQFSVAFFATILTGEAVIFALAFSASSAWPSLREIDAYIAFRLWVVIGWLGAMLLGAGLLVDDQAVSTCGAVLFLVADLLGIFSFVRLFGLASAGGRKQLLSRTLERRLSGIRAPLAQMPAVAATDEVLLAYLREFDAAVVAADGNAVRDRIEELAAATPVGPGAEARAAMHLDVLHRLGKAALAGRLDGSTAATGAQLLVDSLLVQIDAARTSGHPEAMPGDRAAALAGHLGRYLAWLSSTAWTMSARQVADRAAARELVTFAVRARDTITFTLDPDPPFADSDAALGSVVESPLAVLAWIRQFVEFHGSGQANAFYPVFELLTGTKFHGNYWDGGSVLGDLREALFGADRVETPQADRARADFGSVEEFDRVWTLVSVGAVATLRNAGLAHPPELIRPEFTPDRALLSAYLRTYATHRYLHTGAQAHTALLRLVGHAERSSSLWARSSVLLRESTYPVPLPTTEPRQRIAATVLAVACRLAPLRSGDDTAELRRFLERLPAGTTAAVHRLAARTLPAPPGPTADEPLEDLIGRLEIIRSHPAAEAT